MDPFPSKKIESNNRAQDCNDLSYNTACDRYHKGSVQNRLGMSI